MNECWVVFFFFSSRRRHTRLQGDWSSDVCSSDLAFPFLAAFGIGLAYLRSRVDSVYPGMIVHGLFNAVALTVAVSGKPRSEEHTSELQSPCNLVCRLLLEKKKQQQRLPVTVYTQI